MKTVEIFRLDMFGLDAYLVQPEENKKSLKPTRIRYILLEAFIQRLTMAITDKKIGFIGTGKMGTALIKGLVETSTVEPKNICASDISNIVLENAVQEYHIVPCVENDDVVNRSDVIILAVTPQILENVLHGIKDQIHRDHIVISIAAGTPIKFIQEHLNADTKIIRVMPNITVTVNEAPSAISLGQNVSYEDAQIAKNIFESVGRTVVISESLMDAVTGLSGSGPAFVAIFIEAMADAGVYCGLDRGTALTLAAQTVLGSAKMVLDLGIHPDRLKEMVTSPAGTTIEGIHKLEEHGFRAGIMDAMIAATRRSAELGGR